ncbi:hypothetical protein GCM10019016_127380 [Streptomyces prasinosporus]|uniref:IS6 family transposase n=1 Tax=Streptomyces prasinosporus TaxID=68256 RepID=A0ABP6U9T3_9ACTN
MDSASPSYKGHRSPVKVISPCVWLYFRFPLSFHEVEELMLQRGVIVSYETVRRWCAEFGQAYANGLRSRRPRPRPGDTWHLDEVFIKVNGELSTITHKVLDGMVEWQNRPLDAGRFPTVVANHLVNGSARDSRNLSDRQVAETVRYRIDFTQ